MRFEIYRDSCKKEKFPWRWRLLEVDGRVIALSAAGYAGEGPCREAITALSRLNPTISIETRRRDIVIDLAIRRIR